VVKRRGGGWSEGPTVLRVEPKKKGAVMNKSGRGPGGGGDGDAGGGSGEKRRKIAKLAQVVVREGKSISGKQGQRPRNIPAGKLGAERNPKSKGEKSGEATSG